LAHNLFGLTATPIIFTDITIQGNGATWQPIVSTALWFPHSQHFALLWRA
jgi:hypothetical protein